MRGVLWALQVAASTERVLLLHHTDPIPLEEVRSGLLGELSVGWTGGDCKHEMA